MTIAHLVPRGMLNQATALSDNDQASEIPKPPLKSRLRGVLRCDEHRSGGRRRRRCGRADAQPTRAPQRLHRRDGRAGAEAVAWGVANRALPAANVLDHAVGIARDIATNVAPMSAALSKRLLWDTAINGYTPQQVASLETELHRRVMGTDDAHEGVNAFLGRRTPRFSARLSTDWTPLPEA